MEFLFPARWCVGSNQIPSRLAFSSSVLETLNSLIAFSLRTENFPREAWPSEFVVKAPKRFLICGLGGFWNCTRTPPGNLKLFKTAVVRSWFVPGMGVVTEGKWAFMWFLLLLCQSAHILSIKPWCSINSGAAAESNEHMVPPIKQCTVSWRFIRNAISKESNSEWGILNTSATAAESGVLSLRLNWRRRQPPPADGTTFQTPRLNGPLVTHCWGVCSPFPPKPLFPENHKSDALPRHGERDTWLQSQ